jgi:hypothetical protein
MEVDMSERVQRITTQTLIPLALVIGAISVTWALASDRQQAIERISNQEKMSVRHEQELGALRGQLDYLAKAMIRVETALGTLPKARE